MKEMFKRVPLPLCGVMLGTAALGNLLQSYSGGIRYVFGMISGLLLIIMLMKLILFPGMIRNDLDNPILASVSATFPMALMLLSVYAKPWIGQVAFYIWIMAILLHVILIVFFTIKFIVKLQMPKVFASYFIVYVGIAVAAITAPTYEQFGIGIASFWFGLVSLIVLFILVTIRYVKYKEVPEPAKPLICIYAAPTSLCIVGYIQSITNKSYTFLMILLVVASILYVFALVKGIGYLKLPFYPSYASFTFPFVISAIAVKQTNVCLINMGRAIPILASVVMIETVIAVVLVVYTLIRFFGFLCLQK